MSRIPGPTFHHPFSRTVPPRTPGILGRNDAGDPHAKAQLGDTPGSLGVNDHSAELVVGTKVQVRSYPPPIFASFSSLSDTNLEKLKAFAQEAARCGLPAKFLSRVFEKYAVKIVPDDEYQEQSRYKLFGVAVKRKLKLHADTLDQIQLLHPGVR